MRIAAFDMGIKNFAFVIMDNDYVRMMDHHDFTKESSDLYRRLIHHLHSYDSYWKDIDLVLIEQQMNRLNINALRMACHVAAFFYNCFPDICVMEYPSIYKTRYLGGHNLSYPERKAFAINKVATICQDDPVLLDWFSTLSKNDDVADCILMCHTFPASPLFPKYQKINLRITKD